MALILKQLGQTRPSDTTAASIYSPGEGTNSAIIAMIVICNTTNAEAKYRIFHDEDGTTYDEDTALYYDVVLAANSTHRLRLFACMDSQDSNLAVRTSVSNALNFTVYGVQV